MSHTAAGSGGYHARTHLENTTVKMFQIGAVTTVMKVTQPTIMNRVFDAAVNFYRGYPVFQCIN